ncbi:MAG: hypothetical protein SA339_00255 [Methanomassiliicoccus sp.]|nr:hypothetical protein [Methanomassiliicoccus sp.]
MRPLKDLIKPLFNFHDPTARARLLRLFWMISLFMLVLGYVIILYILFFNP